MLVHRNNRMTGAHPRRRLSHARGPTARHVIHGLTTLDQDYCIYHRVHSTDVGASPVVLRKALLIRLPKKLIWLEDYPKILQECLLAIKV